ncbi:aminopeptidase N [Pseudoblastomonas halimionae]|uniref:Aminopeptidase N n=1 Tax=Alteriqipengyuania halimionae TaxID=1926630 RepID=A0A6I4U5G0_9SPHN|nr:aminopeptidase N [Alteriqipengyuania halimionae]MXP10966.1 aminopeptidase N [Alteriqipengyuania halimionae]
MDVARTPSTADGNPMMADAPPEPHVPATIRREDYTPPAWLVPEVALHFDLGIEKTVVRSELKIVRNHTSDRAPNIRLNGDEIEPRTVLCNGKPCESWTMDGNDLLVSIEGDEALLSITTELTPDQNSKLMGLYASNGMLCTQCEAEGFRRITFFPDRPDVLSTYTVRMEAPKDVLPVLLCNGNKTGEGDLDGGRHWAEWHDPWPKPSYLFALVAGDLVALEDSFTTMGGREVDLAIWVREADLGRTQHAMDSLKKSMKWDEETFGREYDLDVFNIVAVGDFNMGAMENKGLNIFNTKYVLADPETATDGDYDGVEGVIAHEYFHNWSGNRVTCRDWFQLSLKEGFTVLRDQLFSQDMQGEAVKRIEDVRVLRAVQFPEDSGPLSHPIRPDSYQEISNFYTSTVYNKGAEVIRMMRSMAGEEAFRKGSDLYFERHDGEAATCEDFITAIEDGAGLDLKQFRRWYEQAGTPRVSAAFKDGQLQLTQEVPATPGQPDKQPAVIPLRVALFDRSTGKSAGERLVVLDQSEASFSFEDSPADAVLSINRGFTAPVALDVERGEGDLVFLAANDDDPFARYEALQELVIGHLLAEAGADGAARSDDTSRAALGEAFAAILDDGVVDDGALDDQMRGEMLLLPPVAYLCEQVLVADPVALHQAREGLKAWLGSELRDRFEAMHDRASAVPYSLDRKARGARKVKTQALVYLAAADGAAAASRAKAQYDRAGNMTDRQGALMVLAGLEQPERDAALEDFHARFDGNDLAIDKWFALQAGSLHPDVISQVKALADHPDFRLNNPNRVRSLYMAFAANKAGFHDPSGEGYRLIADLILALDPINPQTAARFVPPFGRWKRMAEPHGTMMREQLERIAAADGLSRDTYEQVNRSLG